MIHKFSMKGTNIVVDVNSGAVHVFDDLSYEILDYYKKYDNEKIIEMLSDRYDKLEIKEALEEIQSLEKDGQLYSEDIYKDHLPVGDAKPVVKALCLHISHDCNLRCKYCFASTGDFGRHRSVMSPEVGKKAIDFLLRESGGRRNLEVDFFGGEPLLNFDTVKEIVNYALEKEKEYNKHFRFTITTNAVLLNEDHKKFINEHMSNVVLSIDGRPEVNDRMRFRIDGTGTYKDILPKIKDMAESRNQTNYYVRGTFTRENLDFSKDVIHLADQGFKQISVEPVVAAKDSGYDLREEDLPVLFEEYEKLAYEYVKRQKEGNGFNFFHFMIDLNQGPCIAKRITGCGAGHEYLAITPEGDIYPCHQFVGMDDFKMGTVMDGKLNTDIQNYFRNSNVYTKKECMQCWARFYCSGGCAANEYQFNGDINVPYKVGCELEKKRVECALWIKTQE
ncbi:thioether cross-link-forming SCIFF peptide maturase [Pseudoclostridium thermosuccinogenes]|uniref:thioether cross-link-forming SCIFF peptide maturase n=1 Tax=Clostridium thermosuccinogenes TaxID=84032 RepID=UPI000CCBE84A|nr:thioether cross-link-forming SCIFF peptide maturase [Pseudoclostridium thermosuccinogenes]PNT94402.1 thioether cross-link-forming SCIFF peptide maturase [Pseudoclostridium thermosuccinogenes]